MSQNEKQRPPRRPSKNDPISVPTDVGMDHDADFRRNPRRKKPAPSSEGPIPFSELMRDARLPSRVEQAALAVVARWGGTVFTYAPGLLVVPQDEAEYQLLILKSLAVYERMRRTEALEVEFARNPNSKGADASDEDAEDASEDDDLDEEEDEENE